MQHRLKRIPPDFDKAISTLCRKIVTKYPKTLALVLIGSLAEGDYSSDSDIDMVWLRKGRIRLRSSLNLLKSKDLQKRVQLIPMNKKMITRHFNQSTTMAHAIKRGIVLYERGDVLRMFLEINLSMPSIEWLRDWFEHWTRIYELGLKDMKQAPTFHRRFCREECHCDISDNLARGCVNFCIIFLELRGCVPTTKAQIRKGFKQMTRGRRLIQGLETALKVHHEGRSSSLEEAKAIYYTSKWLKRKIERLLQ
jgi:predicted nucleotidyltransferase